jgi:hypothetical protein
MIALSAIHGIQDSLISTLPKLFARLSSQSSLPSKRQGLMTLTSEISADETPKVRGIKRRRNEVLSGNDHVEASGTSQKKTSESLDEPRKPPLACPFFQNDPTRYQRCRNRPLGSIRQLKRHLLRRHKMPCYCPVCLHIFPDEASRDHHVRLESCQARSSDDFHLIDGITREQQLRLAFIEKTATTSEQESWFRIFDVLFPGCERPATPYLTDLQAPQASKDDGHVIHGNGPTDCNAVVLQSSGRPSHLSVNDALASRDSSGGSQTEDDQ